MRKESDDEIDDHNVNEHSDIKNRFTLEVDDGYFVLYVLKCFLTKFIYALLSFKFILLFTLG